jgi:hypothetical protein
LTYAAASSRGAGQIPAHPWWVWAGCKIQYKTRVSSAATRREKKKRKRGEGKKGKEVNRISTVGVYVSQSRKIFEISPGSEAPAGR